MNSGVKEVGDGKETEIRYTYVKAGNRICIEKSEDTVKKQLIENQYKEANRLTTSLDSVQGETTYEYDKKGNLKQELAPGEEVVEYHYDIENRLNSVTEQGTLLMAALYDGDGNRIFKVEKKSSSYEESIAKHSEFQTASSNLGDDIRVAEEAKQKAVDSKTKRVYKPSPKHDTKSGWGSPNPIPNKKVGQKLLDSAYSSSKNKQLYNYYKGQIVKFQPDTVEGWHAYTVENTAKEVPTDVLRKMLKDKLISKKEYLKFIKNK